MSRYYADAKKAESPVPEEHIFAKQFGICSRRRLSLFFKKGLTFYCELWYTNCRGQCNAKTRRSRVVGRARAIGNRVGLNGSQEFESLLLRHEKTAFVFRTKAVFFNEIHPIGWVKSALLMKSPAEMKSASTRMGGFHFICEADFIRALLGFHRALRDFIENTTVLR